MNRYSIITLFLISVVFWTCKPDFVELDLSKSTVELISPVDNFQTTTLTHTFWWYEVEGAIGYDIQVVSPSFASPNSLTLDSNTVSDQYSVTLTPGTYEWQVRAYNGSSVTPYTTYTLNIDSTTDISAQIMVLLSPVNNWSTNQTTVTFKWDTLYNADDYRIEIYTPDFNGTAEMPAQIIDGDSVTHAFTQEGVFQWRVRGQNAFSNSAYTTYTMEVDTTIPNTPLLSSPANNAILSDTLNTLFWDRGVVSGSAITDSLFIYRDTAMTDLWLDVSMVNPSYSGSIGVGNFYWRVLSIDAAGNRSSYSALRKFTVQ